MIINQNYHQGWKAKVRGGTIAATNTRGLISVFLPSGQYQLTLYYLPESFLIGLFITISFVVLGLIKYLQMASPKCQKKIESAEINNQQG